MVFNEASNIIILKNLKKNIGGPHNIEQPKVILKKKLKKNKDYGSPSYILEF